MKKVKINESTFNRLFKVRLDESLSSIVFHYTYLPGLLGIVKNNQIFLQSGLAGNGADNTNTKELYYMSLTRSKSPHEGFAAHLSSHNIICRIEFDGDKLNQRFKAQPIDYWGAAMGKQSYYNPENSRVYGFKDKQEHHNFEMEDRLLSQKPIINNADQYIKRIDILLQGKEIDDLGQLSAIKSILTSIFQKRTFVYGSMRDFIKQNDNIINDSLFEKLWGNDQLTGSIGYNDGDRKNVFTYSSTLGYICDLITSNSENKERDASEIVRKNGLEKYLNKRFFSCLKNNAMSWSELCSKISNSLHELSKHPTEDGQKITHILNSYFQKNGLKNFRDFIKLKATTGEYINDDLIDYDKTINLTIFMRNDSDRGVILSNPNRDKFADVVISYIYDGDIDYFARQFATALINYQYDNYGETKYSERSIENWIKKQIKNGISVKEMNDLVRGYCDKDTANEILGGRIVKKNVQAHQTSYYVLPSPTGDFYSQSKQDKNKIKSLFFKK